MKVLNIGKMTFYQPLDQIKSNTSSAKIFQHKYNLKYSNDLLKSHKCAPENDTNPILS